MQNRLFYFHCLVVTTLVLAPSLLRYCYKENNNIIILFFYIRYQSQFINFILIYLHNKSYLLLL